MADTDHPHSGHAFSDRAGRNGVGGASSFKPKNKLTGTCKGTENEAAITDQRRS